MNGVTYLSAYRRAFVMCMTMRDLYGKSYGIAVDKTNYHALRWQKFDRQARKFEDRLFAVLQKADSATK